MIQQANFRATINVHYLQNMYMKKLYIFLFFIATSFIAPAQLLINEYSCSNINTIADGFGMFEDWVELYNAGSTNINVTGYFLSDDPNTPLKWAIPATTDILPNTRRMVFCSNRGVVTAAGQIHPDFKLTQTHNEWFLISDAAGNLIDSVHLNLTQRGHSRGRTTDGANTWSLFTTPTANAANASSTPYTAYASKPIFSVAPGNYTSTQNISLSTTEPNITIRYTLDGSTPTLTSTVFTTPINVASTTVIRAKCFSSNANIAPSFTETNTYLINESTLYNVVSVSGSIPTLFSNGQGVVCSYEFFDRNKNFKIEFEGFARRHGHDSWAYPQKGFKVYAEDENGYAAEHATKYFKTSTRDSFNMVIFKAGASDNYQGGPQNAAHMRDVFAHTLAEKYELEMDYRKYEPTIIYVNGQYWGLYEIRERVDKDFFEYYYGRKEDKVDNLRYWGGMIVGPGTANGWNWLTNFITTNNMADPNNYQVVKDSLNIKSFIQYFIFNQYLVNSDWLNWNTHWWRARGNANTRVKWRYSLWDEDNILDLGQNYTGLGTTTANNNPCDAFGLFQNSSSIKHTQMLNKLMTNTEFKNTYDQQWLYMLSTCFECTNILKHFDSIKNIIEPEMQRHINRWGGTYADWTTNWNYLRSQIQSRCTMIGGKLDSCMDLNPQTLKLNVSPTNAGNIALDGNVKSPYVYQELMKGDSIYTLKATPTLGQYWTFDHWEFQNSANSMLPNTTTDQVQYNFKSADSVIAYFKYFNYDSVKMAFDVTPAGTGSILLNGFLIPSYPTVYTLDRQFSYQIKAVAQPYFQFISWSKSDPSTMITPNLQSKNADFTYMNQDMIVANFDSIPLPPPLPELNGLDKNVFIPNAFSPNGDHKNDVFNIKISKDVIGIDMLIFDRFGNKIYHTNNVNAGWNGRYKDRDCEIGTYQYLIQIKFRDQSTKMFSGDVTLLH